MLERKAFLADVVYNGLGTPRSDGAVVIQEASGELLIVAVDAAEEVRRRYPDIAVAEVGFALSPAPANAHTHLDLSDMPYHPGDYLAFIRAAVDQGRQGRHGLASARRGAEELMASGVFAVGDIVTDEEVMTFLLGHPKLTGVAYWEVIGPDPADADRLLRETVERVHRFRALERRGGVRIGLSPHTPHTVSAPLLSGLAQVALRERLPVQIHVGESPHEATYHQRGGGPLTELMGAVDPDFQASGLSPVGYLERLGVLEAAPALVHMVHVTEEDVRTVQRSGCVVVHCPRSNEALECGRFPWELYARHGVTVAIGTDSRGSSPSLSVVEEVAAARRLHGAQASPLALVRAAVKGGHRALGSAPPKVLRGAAAEALTVWRDGVAVPLSSLDV